jgi:type II secretory pathway component PulF
MLKKVTLTNMNTKRSVDVFVDTDEDGKAIIGSGKAPNELAKVSNIEGIDESIHRLTLPRPNLDDRVALFAGVARCLERNISTIKSFELQANRLRSPRYRGVVADISAMIAQGEKVSDAMTKHSALFGDAMLALVRAGEEAGQLPEVCRRIAVGQKKTLRIIKKLKSGMIYPAIVLFIGVSVVIVMSYTLVPAVATLYGSFKADLPGATKFMMALSQLLIHKPWVLVFPFMGIFLLFKNWGKLMAIPNVQRLLIKLPTIGNIVRKSAAAVSFRCLAMLLEANVRVSTALRITGESAPNIIYKEFFQAVQRHTEDGLALPESFLLESHRLGPEGRSISGLMEISSETGSSTDMLDEVANDYEDDLDTIGNQIDKIIEPFTIVILGCMVGFLIYAIYSPIFSLGNVVLPKTKPAAGAPGAAGAP